VGPESTKYSICSYLVCPSLFDRRLVRLKVEDKYEKIASKIEVLFSE